MNSHIINQYKRMFAHLTKSQLYALPTSVYRNENLHYAVCELITDAIKQLPGQCPLCGYSIDKHDYMSASATEPEEYICPDVNTRRFVARDQGRMSDTLYYDLLESQITF